MLSPSKTETLPCRCEFHFQRKKNPNYSCSTLYNLLLGCTKLVLKTATNTLVFVITIPKDRRNEI